MSHNTQEEIKGFPENRQPTCSHYLTKEGGCPCDCHRSLARKDEISCYSCIPYPKDWREEFRKQFINLCTIVIPIAQTASDNENHKLVERGEEVEKFISNLLTAQLQNVVEELEGMKKPYNPKEFDNARYNQAISDAQTIIRGKIDK